MNSSSSEARQREKIATEIFLTADEACRRLGAEIVQLIAANTAA